MRGITLLTSFADKTMRQRDVFSVFPCLTSVCVWTQFLAPPQQPSLSHCVPDTGQETGELPSEIGSMHYWKAHNTKCINVSNAIHNQPINTSCLWLGLIPGTAKSRHSFLHHQSGCNPRKCWSKCAVWAVAYPRSLRDTDFPPATPGLLAGCQQQIFVLDGDAGGLGLAFCHSEL